MKLPESFMEIMINHAEKGYPYECCGLLAGKDGAAEKIYELTNMLKSPVRYQVDPTQHIKALKDMEKLGLELIGVFHSHPDTEAYPSGTDINLAFYPEIEYIIISLANRQNPIVKSFSIVDEKVNEKEIIIHDY